MENDRVNDLLFGAIIGVALSGLVGATINGKVEEIKIFQRENSKPAIMREYRVGFDGLYVQSPSNNAFTIDTELAKERCESLPPVEFETGDVTNEQFLTQIEKDRNAYVNCAVRHNALIDYNNNPNNKFVPLSDYLEAIPNKVNKEVEEAEIKKVARWYEE